MKNTKTFATVLFVFLLFSPVSVSYAKPSPLAIFPIKIVDNRTHILFDGPNGKRSFLLDTGATSSVFFESNNVPESAYDDSDETQIRFPAVNKSVTGKRISTYTLRSGDATFESRGGVLLSDDKSLKNALEAEFSGIIGQELFTRYVVEIDPENEEMRLYENGTDLRDEHEIEHYLRMEGRTPYITFRSRLPWEKSVSRKNMLLDSGYPGGMVLWNRKHYMMVTSLSERNHLEKENMGVLTAATIKFGSLKFESMPIFIASSIPDQAQGRDGLIGASILSQYRYVIDFSTRRLLMTPILDEEGDPIQIVDGAVYTPNNEDFLVKFFGKKISIMPVMTLYTENSTHYSPFTERQEANK